jgi:hypothetical protein
MSAGNSTSKNKIVTDKFLRVFVTIIIFISSIVFSFLITFITKIIVANSDFRPILIIVRTNLFRIVIPLTQERPA